jgi:hypothetical protein
MAARKKAEKKPEPEPEETEIPEDVPEMSEGMMGGGGVADMLPKETQMHLFKAATELAMALENVMPKRQMPDDVKQHAVAAQREFLLMLRAFLDHQIEGVDKKCGAGSKQPETRLKKIDVQ